MTYDVRPRAAAAVLVLLALAAPALAQKSAPKSQPAPSAPAPAAPQKHLPGKFTSPKLRGWINDTPDTGQFLADSVWLLRVGPRVTNVGDFIHSWFTSYPEYRPGPDSAGRVKYLNSLMNKDVLGMTAEALNRPLGFEDRLALRETRERSLAQAVYQRYVRDSITVSEAEVRALYEGLAWVQHLRHILVADRVTADRVRRDLVAGRITWSVAVKKYSMSKHDNGADGELGWVTRDKLDPMIAYWVYGLKPGETSQPVKDLEGWHIVQSIERKPTPPPAYEPMSRMLRSQAEQVKAGIRTEQLLATLRIQTHMVYDTANAEYAASRFGETVTFKKQPMATTLEVDASTPDVGDDTSRVIARWQNGGRYSLGDLLHDYTAIPPILRPALNRTEAVIDYVETTVLQPYIAEYGAQRGLEKDPLVTEPIRLKHEELMVQHMYDDSVGSKVWVGKDDRKAYYQKHLKDFFTFPWVQFAAITRPSKAGADSVMSALKSGMTAQALLAADSAKGRQSGSIQVRNNQEHGLYQKVLFNEMRTGDIQINGPDKAGDYVVIQLMSFNGGRQLSFEESETMIDESLQNQESEAALNAMIGRLKKRYPIAMRPDLVMLIRLSDPTLD